MGMLSGSPSSLRGYNFTQNDASDGSEILDKSLVIVNRDKTELLDANNFGNGEIAKHLLLHELGHSMGLEDVWDVSELQQTGYNNQKYSVMSYVDFNGIYATELQLFDIAALQEKWGSRNYTTRQENTTYSKDNILWNPDNTYGATLYTTWG